MPLPKKYNSTQKAGIRYEKKAVKYLKAKWSHAELRYHQWIKFADRNGVGWAEPELFIVLKDRVILFEMKLTGGPAGRMQMERLYKPLLEHIFKRPVHCLLVCRNVTEHTPGPRFQTPEDFIISGASFGTWHWLGDTIGG